MHYITTIGICFSQQVRKKNLCQCLPAGTTQWVRCHQLTSLGMVVMLAEDHLVAQLRELLGPPFRVVGRQSASPGLK